MLQKHFYKIALLISLLLHVLVIWFYKPLASVLQLVPETSAQTDIAEPLVFEFEDPEPPRELVETPEDARTDQAPQDAQFLSDKNAQSQDMYTDNDLAPGLSFSEGDLDYKLFAGDKTQGEQMQMPPNEQQPDAEQGQDEQYQEEQESSDAREFGEPLLEQPRPQTRQMRPKFSKELLFGNDRTNASGRTGFTDDANWNNRESSAQNLGGVSLSTYEWNFAPYIQHMKKTFQDHFYAPAALYHLGIIEGYVVIGYTVQRNGTITNIRLLDNKGHETLVNTTINMIKASSPLKPLPHDFPDNVLNIEFTFIFTLRQ